MVRFLLTAVALVVSSVAAHAQFLQWRDTTLKPERIPYNLRSDDFPIGVYYYLQNAPTAQAWPYLHGINVNLLHYNVLEGGWPRYDSLMDATADGDLVQPNVQYSPSTLDLAGFASEAVFFPFDSSQLRAVNSWFVPYFYENVFTRHRADDSAFNSYYADADNHAPRESIYLPRSAGDTVASGIAFHWNPQQTYRFANQAPSADRVINASELLTRRVVNPAVLPDAKTYHLVVTGHVFPSEGEADTTRLLRVNIYYETPQGMTYRTSSGDLEKARTNLRRLYASFDVTHGDLRPPPTSPDNYNIYRDVLFDLPLDTCAACRIAGPLYPDNESKQLDIEVIYLGHEQLALRSITLRDHIAQLLVGDDDDARAFRARVIAEADRFVRRPDVEGHPVRSQIFGLIPTNEADPMHVAGYRDVARLLKENIIDSEGNGLGNFAALGHPHIQHLGDADWVSMEMYFNVVGLVSNNVKRYPNNVIDYRLACHIDHQQPPSIRQHGGGYANIPLLFDIDSLGDRAYDVLLRPRIESAEETMQNVLVGRYTPWVPQWPYNSMRIYFLGQAARTAHATGRRLMTIVGAVSGARIMQPGVDGRRDTLIGHRAEPAELRSVVSIGLAYGSKAISYYEINTYPWIEPQPDGSFEMCCMGFGGQSLADTASDIRDWPLLNPRNRDTMMVIPRFYGAWRSTREEMRNINAWLTRIGPVLTRLRWRDAYSVHWQTPRPGGKDAGFALRPLPSNELVASVESIHPLSGAKDSAWATYVELGLFETMIDVRDGRRLRLLDSNFVMVVNRRSFETPNAYDLPAATAAKLNESTATRRLLDSLSESRIVRLRFNLRHPDATQPGYIRVTERVPDVTPLPYAHNTPRQPLDTVVMIDSAVSLLLGPGRAALLQIRYLPGDKPVDGEIPLGMIIADPRLKEVE